jgi:signal transduction histidine kinase/HAMP domain-containing protein/CHASE3 domain sensor protein
MKWTIGRKLTLSFLVVAVLMGIIGYSGLYGMNQIDASTKKILEEQQPVLTEVSDIKSDLLVCRLKLDQYIATGNKAHLQSTNSLLKNVNESLLFLESKDLTGEEQGLLDSIRNAFNSYNTLIDSLVSFYDNAPSDAVTIATKKVRIDSLLENAMLIKLDLLHNAEERKAIELGELNHIIYYDSLWTLLLLSAVLITMGGLSSFLISRGMAGSLSRMARVVPDIARGKFGQTVDVRSKDEIGELASAFNQMTRDLKQSQDQIRRHALELEQKVRERTRDLDDKVKEMAETKTAILNMMEDTDESNRQLIRTQDELEKSLGELKEMDIKKDQFISIAAHELKTPLTSIHGFSQLLQNRKVANNFTKRNKYLKIMDHETKRLAKLVGDILDLSRIDLGTVKLTFENIDVNKLMGDIKREMDVQIKEKGLDSEYEVERGIPDMLTDSEKLTEILINIIMNAVKYTPKGKITVKVYREKENVHFVVKDTGIGISKENQEKVFDRFYQVDSSYTRKEGGTGLGLAICKEFVEILGGRIWLKSELCKGSELHFTLPVKGTNIKQISEVEKKARERLKESEKTRKDIEKMGFGRDAGGQGAG